MSAVLQEIAVESSVAFEEIAKRFAKGEEPTKGEVREAITRAGRSAEDLQKEVERSSAHYQASDLVARIATLNEQIKRLSADHMAAAKAAEAVRVRCMAEIEEALKKYNAIDAER